MFLEIYAPEATQHLERPGKIYSLRLDDDGTVRKFRKIIITSQSIGRKRNHDREPQNYSNFHRTCPS